MSDTPSQKKSRLEPRSHYTDEDINKAMADIDDLGMSIRAAGRKYGIPEATLRHKKTGYHPVSKKMGPGTVLTDAEEDILVAYIKGSLRRAQPVTRKNIFDAVSTILRTEREGGIKRKTPTNFQDAPRRKWWRLFRQRHPEITYRTPETLTSNRKNISKNVIQQWFADAQSYFADEGHLDALNDPSRQFNIDESGFSLSPKQGKVIGIKGEKHVFEESGMHHKTNITVLANVCADGRIPPPLIIYPRKRITAHMAEHFPEDFICCVGKSESGYITFETLYEYLCNSFNVWLNDNNVTRPVIMWTDWHETRNNYYLAKQLQELNIILYGLPPNTTHMMQPLDVAVFGPLKKEWSRGAKNFEHKNPDSVINQVNFAEVFLPIYYSCISDGNIRSGFSKCGLYPFNSDSPDYSKLESASAQQEEPASLFEGIETEGRVERSVQTVFTHVTHRGTQSIAENFKKVCIDFLQLEGYAIVTPEERAMVNNLLACQKSSHDDLLVDFKPRTSGHMLLNRNGDFSSVEDRPASTVTTPSTSRPTTPAPPHRSTTPITSISPGPSTNQADISRRSSVSPAFRSFEFYPVRREGRGPKKIRDDLDRTFAITSTKAVSILKRKMEEKEARESKRVTRGRGRKTGSKKQTPPPSLHNKTSDESEPEDNPIIQDSDDSGSLELDDYSLCVKLPLEEPKVGAFVGVKVHKESTSMRGRKQHKFEIHIGTVEEVEEEGLKISFLNEFAPGFYVNPEREDVSFPVYPDEVVVLENPEAETRNRKFGYKFNSGVKAAIEQVLGKKNE